MLLPGRDDLAAQAWEDFQKHPANAPLSVQRFKLEKFEAVRVNAIDFLEVVVPEILHIGICAR